MKAHSRYLRSNPWESSRALGVILLTICALFPTLVLAAAAEERPVEAEVKPSQPSIQERSPKQAVKPIADPPMIRSLPTGENKTGVSSQSISVPKGPGTIEGMGERGMDRGALVRKQGVSKLLAQRFAPVFG